MTARILALVATIPPRRASCERLLGELAAQSRPPDGVILCLDGYAPALLDQAPVIPASLALVPTFAFRVQVEAGAGSGPGCRWRLAWDLLGGWDKARGVEALGVAGGSARQAARDLAPDDIVISIDDDPVLSEAPRFVEALAETVEACGGAAAAMGYTHEGYRAAPGPTSRGRLILGCGCGLAVRAGHLLGLHALAVEVLQAGGPDALGPCGDDQALVSAHLWRRGVPLFHAAVGPLSFAEGTQRGSQFKARKARGEPDEFAQARRIAEITGWPLPAPVVEVHEQPALSWEAELSAVPHGAVRARGAAPPAGWRRVLVVDAEESERNGVYDAPRS